MPTTLMTITFTTSQLTSTISYNGGTFTATDGTFLTYTNNDGFTSILASAFATATDLETINIPTSVTIINDSAFQYLNNLTTVTFDASSSLTTLGNHVFASTILNAFSFSNLPLLTTLGNYVFFNTQITSITFPTTITTCGTDTFESSERLSSFIFALPCGLTTIPDSFFYGCINSSFSVIIPDTITEIGSSAFDSSSLSSINIPNSVTSIDSSAFRNTALSTITLPNTVRSIGNNAFQLTILNSVENSSPSLTFETTTVFDASFNNSSKTLYTYNIHTPIYSYVTTNYPLTSIVIQETTLMTISFTQSQIQTEISYNGGTFVAIDETYKTYVNGDGFTSILSGAFTTATYLKSVNIPTSVTSIGDYAFSNSSISNFLVHLESVTFDSPSSLVTLGVGSFYGASSLTTFTLPSSVTTGNVNTFKNCTGLTSFIFESPSSLTDIPQGFLSTCSSLTSIIIPNSVTSIGALAFTNSNSLTTVTFESTSIVTLIDTEAFYNSNINTITIPKSVVTINHGAFQAAGILNITFESPSSLTTIGSNVFLSCNFTTVTIPNSVTSIGDLAFYDSNLLWSENSSPSLTFGGTSLFSPSYNNSHKTLYTASIHTPMYSYVHTNFPLTTIIIGPSCYNEDTQILTEDGYVEIHKIKVGTNIKTLNDGYKKVLHTHYQPFTANNKNNGMTMYKLNISDKYNNDFNIMDKKFDSLTISGNHCILIDKQEDYMKKYVKGQIEKWMIDGKYISLSQANPDFKPLEDGKKYNVYHLILENEDKNRRYAIYANGILSESMSEGHYLDMTKNHKNNTN